MAISVLGSPILLAGCAAQSTTPTRPPSPSVTSVATPTTTPYSLAAVGDSLTLAANSCGKFAACEKNSWVTGSAPEVDSLAARIRATHRDLTVENHAKVGVGASDLPRQVQEAATSRPDLLTIMIGANDVCATSVEAMTPTDAFQGYIARTFDEIEAKLPTTVVYVSSVPDLTELVRVVGQQTIVQSTWGHSDACDSVLAEPSASSSDGARRRESVRARIVDLNQILENACKEHSSCVWDDSAVFRARLTPDKVSTLDYFHPSPAGQAQLASIAWARLHDRVEAP